MLKILYNRIKKDIENSKLHAVDLDLQKLLMNTKYPHSDYQYLIQLKCTVKKIIESHKTLTDAGVKNMLSSINHAIKLSKQVQMASTKKSSK